MSIHAFTSCSYSYLNRARVLASSLKRQHPDWVLWLVMTDKEPEGFTLDLDKEDYDRIVTAEELFGDETESWLFGHDIVEACTAVKGRACVHILSQPDCEKLVYFDPDIAVFNPMDEVLDLLDDYSIVLTPHQTDPDAMKNRTAIIDNEITSLSYGIFNLGFIALANDDEGRRFAQWWDDRLHDWCHDDLEHGIFVDQKWCNLVPCFFDGVKVLRDPGYNVASWNLSNREMRYDADGNALINDRPLRFYHFTKLGPVGDTMTQRYAGNNIEIYELWWWYRNAVLAATSNDIPKGWWYYGKFDSGVKIPKAARVLYRQRQDLRNAFPDPLKTGESSYYGWLQAETDLMEAGGDMGRFIPV
ncbi:hypothetical protein FQV27_05670 [Paracoccus aurantiacus]|uniref:Glycosyl transferase n=1 Tax=Paracoccus aurantiacus TaxID=2599412 RepID=A0A5C6S4Q5_9RHOB|nr:hypothetical protein [Paracoccus aurantiacus]TXB69610.1 hypothetical protein FQV27_05670 [Paracoccus aurantiacus]